MKVRTKSCLIVMASWLLLCGHFATDCYAARKRDELIFSTESIVVAESVAEPVANPDDGKSGLSRNSDQKKGLFPRTLLHFHVLKILKGPPINPHLTCRLPMTKTVSDQWLSPTVGSKWLLFIPHVEPVGEPPGFELAEEPRGMQPCTSERLEELQRELADSRNFQPDNWDEWNRLIDECLQRQFEEWRGSFSHGPSLSVTVTYSINQKGHVVNAQLVSPSANNRFDEGILRMVRALDGLPILRFPDRSKGRQILRKATFSSTSWYENLQ